MSFQIVKKNGLLILSILYLVGCGTGTVISKDGVTSNSGWHEWDKVILNNHNGTFPDPQSLSQVRQETTKDQLYYLIGRPQYDDGWRPREWNYLSHFNTPGQGINDVTTRQYKVLFDHKMLARSLYWHSVIPGRGVCPPQVPLSPRTSIQRYTLNSNTFFVFDKSGTSDMSQQGLTDLDHLAMNLNSFEKVSGIVVIGHTNRLRSEGYNLTFSRKRAETVRQYLIAKGSPAEKTTSIGMGKSQLVKKCKYSNDRASFIVCLQPNRRVEVEVDGHGLIK